MTISLLNCALHSAATLQTCITASGSSALTWKIGASTTYPQANSIINIVRATNNVISHLFTLAISVQYGEEREYLGSVVNPTWKSNQTPASLCHGFKSCTAIYLFIYVYSRDLTCKSLLSEEIISIKIIILYYYS